MLALASRSRLAFPGGRPGFDPNHPALGGFVGESNAPVPAKGNGFSLIANGASFYDLFNSPVTAASTGSGVDLGIGQYVSFTSSSMNCQLSNQSTTSNSAATYGFIIKFVALTAGYQTFLSAQNNLGNRLLAAHGSNFVCFDAADRGTVAISAGVPFFLGATIRHTSTTNFTDTVAVNLLTGQTASASSSAASGGPVNQSGVWIGNQNNNTAQFSNAFISHAMFAPAGITKAALLKWAGDPWSWWYPGNSAPWPITTFFGKAPAAASTVVFRKTLSQLGTRVGSRQPTAWQ